MSQKPKLLYAENKAEFRIRCISWLLTKEPLRTDDVVSGLREHFKIAIGKEAVERSLHVMFKRKLVKKTKSKIDLRVCLWTPA